MARHKTLQEKFEETDPNTFASIILDAEDWPMVIVAATFLDRMLEFSIQGKFKNKPTPAEEADLFSGYGPLASFSAKIAVAYGLGIISPDARHDLRIIKNIRNEAAHRMKHFSLEDEPSCLSLSLNQAIDLSGEQPSDMTEKLKNLDLKSHRGRFIASTHHIANELGKDLKVLIDAVKVIAATVKVLDTPDLREALKNLGIDVSTLASSTKKSP
jgi:DNA-binding MltR family transcriptional regulator